MQGTERQEGERVSERDLQNHKSQLMKFHQLKQSIFPAPSCRPFHYLHKLCKDLHKPGIPYFAEELNPDEEDQKRDQEKKISANLTYVMFQLKDFFTQINYVQQDCGRCKPSQFLLQDLLGDSQMPCKVEGNLLIYVTPPD